MYLVIRCPRCGELVLANTIYKTRSCQNCKFRIEIRFIKPLARAETPADAVEVMKKLKADQAGDKSWKPNFYRLR